MKLFSILNKPAIKANNKQAGIVFLEYVIMAFIITVAVICALWWFYWHLQQLTWETKQKLDTLKTLNCELGKPGGPESVQPTPGERIGPIHFTDYDGSPEHDLGGTTYPNQRITLENNNPGPHNEAGHIVLWLTYNNGTTTSDINLYDGNSSVTFDIIQTTSAPDGKYHLSITGLPIEGTYPIDYTVTVTQMPSP